MDEQSEVVEGQAIAQEILAALQRDGRADWGKFHEQYYHRLLRIAVRERESNSSLRQVYDSPEEILQDFLAERVYRESRARSMLGESAAGRRPLWPRLATSLVNFCVDRLRRAKVRARERPDEVALESAPAREPAQVPDLEDLPTMFENQMAAIRRHMSPCARGSAPLREALFLRLRLDWVGGYRGARVRRPSSEGEVDFDEGLVEEMTGWTEEEQAIVLGDGGRTLVEAWNLLVPRLRGPVEGPLPAAVVAETLRVSVDTWNVWVSRGRKHLRQELGEEFARLFPFWEK
jgi:DNA-directed RNA polymerase specialized sigma24 family protein